MIEVWANCTLSKTHQVSNLGRVKRLAHRRVDCLGRTYRMKETILKGTPDKDGYLKVHINTGRGCKSLFIHRLVALTFLPNLDNKRTVNHKNCIKTDNRVDNLEWATDRENVVHYFKSKRNEI